MCFLSANMHMIMNTHAFSLKKIPLFFLFVTGDSATE